MSERVNLLQQIFDNVNHWLHFVEAKNAALIAFDIAFIGAIIDSSLLQNCLWVGTVLIIGLSVSGLVALYSFKPINKALKKCTIKDIESNLLHYAYIASLEWNEYIQSLYVKYWDEICDDMSSIPALEKDYCKEIIENARIAMRKQKLFKISFSVVILMLLLFVILVIVA